MRGELRLIESPELAPAVDFITRTGQGPFVDTGVDVVYVPEKRNQKERIILSIDTIRALAQVAGILDEGKSDAARDASLIAQGKLEAVKEGLGERLGDLAGVLTGLARTASGGGGSASGSSVL